MIPEYKFEIITKLSKETGITKVEARKILDVFNYNINDSILYVKETTNRRRVNELIHHSPLPDKNISIKKSELKFVADSNSELLVCPICGDKKQLTQIYQLIFNCVNKWLPEEDIIQDLISIIHVFSFRIYGLRKYKKKIQKEVEDD